MRSVFVIAAATFLFAASAHAGPSPILMAQSAPAAGANSFTEAQAKERIEKAGYTAVSGLTKDDQGIWRGMATKGGRSVKIGVDFKGNVTEG